LAVSFEKCNSCSTSFILKSVNRAYAVWLSFQITVRLKQSGILFISLFIMSCFGMVPQLTGQMSCSESSSLSSPSSPPFFETREEPDEALPTFPDDVLCGLPSILQRAVNQRVSLAYGTLLPVTCTCALSSLMTRKIFFRYSKRYRPDFITFRRRNARLRHPPVFLFRTWRWVRSSAGSRRCQGNGDNRKQM